MMQSIFGGLCRSKVLVFCLWLAATTRMSAQAPDSAWIDEAVRDALSAQLVGFGRCGSVATIDSASTAHFPAVQLFSGRCVAAHGDSLIAVVATDTLGIISLLDSPSAFRFLLRRHPISVYEVVNTIEYTREALSMIGAIRFDAQIVERVTELPIKVRQDLEGSTLPRPLTGVINRGPMMTALTITTFTGSLLTYNYVVLHRTGDVLVSQRVLWKSSSGPVATGIPPWSQFFNN
jgi:hypothetical protein